MTYEECNMPREELYLCKDYSFCQWKGSLEPVDICPVCGHETYTVPCCVTGCSIFYKLGRNLRLRNTGSSKMAGQEGHVEKADLKALSDFIHEIFEV